jgi:gluconolactonase
LLSDRYGFILGYRPQPEIPRQVYMFDPITGAVRVVADGFNQSNGIAFTKDGKRLMCEFIRLLSMGGRLPTNIDCTMQFGYRSFGWNTRTGGPHYDVGISASLLASTFSNKNILCCSYAFDVDSVTLTFKNRRVFAYADCGIPDGIQVDATGNVYAATGDGVQVRAFTSYLPLHIIYAILFLFYSLPSSFTLHLHLPCQPS